jgi:Ser/Thr protein kinase RdoA (MazF antagonist)
MSRLAGRPFGDEPLTTAQVAALARALTRLHGAATEADLAGLPPRRWAPQELLPTLGEWIRDPRAGLPDRVRRAAGAATEWLDSPEAAALAGPPERPVLGQGDGNIGNVIWDGAACTLVDFEDAGVSDASCEVADLLEHVTVSLPDLLGTAGLLDALGFPARDRERVLDFRRLFAALWLLMLMPDGPAHARNPPGSLDRQADRLLRLLAGPD